MKLYLLPLLLPLGCLAQSFGTLSDLPFLSSSATTPEVTPATFGATTWYEPSRGYATNAGIATLSNLTTIGSGYDLTNTAGINSPVYQSAIFNGFAGLFFDKAKTNWLDCTNYITFAPHEVIMAVSFTNFNVNQFLLSGMTNLSTHKMGLQASGAMKHQVAISGSGGGSAVLILTNKYIVLNSVFTPTNSSVFTNLNRGIFVGASTGVSNCFGLRLGKLAMGDVTVAAEGPALASVLAIITFTNQYLSVATRSNVYWYLTNRFGPMPP